MNKRLAYFISALLFLLIIWFVIMFSNQFLLSSVGILIAAFLILIIRFERNKIDVKELVFLAVIIAIAAIARVPFATIPSVQPTTFIIIITAMVFGAESGLIIGAGAALVSNMILGQGPWTPWQMFAWGMVGYSAGLLRNTFIMKQTWSRSLFGFAWGIVFGWIMNLWFIFGLDEGLTLSLIVTSIVGSVTFDLLHGVFNAVFIVIFGDLWIKILKRYQHKYGILS